MNEKREIKTYKSIDEMVEYLYNSKRLLWMMKINITFLREITYLWSTPTSNFFQQAETTKEN